MRDGIALARAGCPAVALVTEKFRAQGEFVARAEGMPDVPQVILAHPVAGSGAPRMAAIAAAAADAILMRLTGR